MLIFATTHGHDYTVGTLTDGSFDAPLPTVAAMTYDNLWRAEDFADATYIFSDLERLVPWELQLASALYRALRAAGMRCLNDPARVMARYELLRTLARIKFNPFEAYRAEDRPRPKHFPVFIRAESDHLRPLRGLIHTQVALDAALDDIVACGTPLRGLLVIEFCAQPIAPGAWRKFGTFRIGEAMHLDHAVVEDSWLVKYGRAGFSTPAMFQAEYDAVAANSYVERIRPAFEAAGIEYGRADHATVDGREVVYEINTAPYLFPPHKQRAEIRDRAQALSRARMGSLFHAIDSGDGRPRPVDTGPSLTAFRHANPDPPVVPKRP